MKVIYAMTHESVMSAAHGRSGEDNPMTIRIDELQQLAGGAGWPPYNVAPLAEALLENFASPE